MPNEEEFLKNILKTTGFILFMLLLSSYFESETVIILLLCLIYLK
jgi:hypothetical protein